MRKRTATTFIALLGILSVLSGCANKGTAAATEAPQTAETTADAVKVREGPAVTPDEEMLSKYFVGHHGQVRAGRGQRHRLPVRN